MDFKPFPKIPRLRRDIVITEKIDGTNAQLMIDEDGNLQAGSRNREITPKQDNYGFALWAYERRDELVTLLGPGRHFGEWWGQGIQRGYGLDHKRFSLFNTGRWAGLEDYHAAKDLGVHVVPVLFSGTMSDEAIDSEIIYLMSFGSKAAPGFMHPEGVVVFHTASSELYKVLLENDEIPKSVAV